MLFLKERVQLPAILLSSFVNGEESLLTEFTVLRGSSVVLIGYPQEYLTVDFMELYDEEIGMPRNCGLYDDVCCWL